MTVTVKIENTYEDGHESTLEVEVEAPEVPSDLEEWWEERVYEHTGDGHGAKYPQLGSWYTATIIRAEDAQLLGMSTDWG